VISDGTIIPHSYKVRARKPFLFEMEIKLKNTGEEKDALYPWDFFTALAHELRGCFHFFYIPLRFWQFLSLLPKCLYWTCSVSFIVKIWFLDHSFMFS